MYLGAPDSDVHSDLLVSPDSKGSDGVPSLAYFIALECRRLVQCAVMLTVDGSLTAELFQHLGGTGQSVTRLADGDIEDELLDRELLHRVLGLFRHLGRLFLRDFDG